MSGIDIIVKEKTKNEFVNGVPLQLIKIAFSEDAYNDMRDFLDTTSKSNIDTSIGEVGRFHGVDVFSTVNIPSGLPLLQVRRNVHFFLLLKQFQFLLQFR